MTSPEDEPVQEFREQALSRKRQLINRILMIRFLMIGTSLILIITFLGIAEYRQKKGFCFRNVSVYGVENLL